MGWRPAIAELAEDGPWQRAQVDIDLPRQSDTAEALVYRTVRELIVNARKHSRATELRVQGRAEGGELVFDVEDDGVGFDVERARDRDRMRMHLGLDTSAERVRIAGGRLDDRERAGTRCPLPAAAAGGAALRSGRRRRAARSRRRGRRARRA